jgi:DNA excision repair protein ERCC-3
MPLTPEERAEYVLTEDSRIKYRIAAENPIKTDVLEELLAQHEEDSVLVIGQYISQLKALAARLDAPLVTGKTPNTERDLLYEEFRQGRIKVLVVSKVANFAIDLPDANVAIQISGTFGSRQEEAQRLGRILRPKKDGSIANFYTLVTRDTKDQDFSTNRQLFLTEQGYSYNIVDAADIVPGLPAKMAELEAELERKKLSGEWDIEARLERLKADEEENATGEKPRRGRKPRAQSDGAEAEAAEAADRQDMAAGAEDQQSPQKRRGRPPKNAGRDHLRLVK